jgi:hypothetical protein
MQDVNTFKTITSDVVINTDVRCRRGSALKTVFVVISTAAHMTERAL